MPLLPPSTRERVRARLSALPAPVELRGAGPARHPLRRLAVELAALSPALRARWSSGPKDRGASLRVAGPAGSRVQYLGLPNGYEFATLMEAIEAAARGPAGSTARRRRALRGLRRTARFDVFVSADCPDCGRAVRAAQRLAAASPRITARVIASSEFPDLVRRHAVCALPHVVLNGRWAAHGVVSEERLLRAARGAAPRRR